MLSYLRRHAAGESLASLAQEAGVRPATMTWWRSQLRRELSSTDSPFIELTLADEAVAERAESPFVVQLGDFRTEVPRDFIGGDLERLLLVLRRC